MPFPTYAPAPEDRSLARLDAAPAMWIAGEEVRTDTTFDTHNPADGTLLARVPAASPADVDAAVTAAGDALGVWSSLPGAVRGRYLFRLARLVAERSRELAVLESLDGGKPIRESRDFDVPMAAQWLFYYAGWADKLDSVVADPCPVGVCAQIVPWNFPLLMAAWKIAPALAAGNTVVLKPAETTPLTALRLAELAAEAGFPPGVINVICGAGDVGEMLVRHDGVDKVAFTGSTAVGRRIAALVAGTAKRVTLELGGKSANIVFADASLDAAVEGIVNSIFFNQGHVCCAGSRLLVEEPVFERLLDRLTKRMGAVRLGDPLDKNTDMGAINSPAQLARIRDLVEVGRAEGAEVHTASCELPEVGNWFAPTLLVGVQPADRVAREEIFGPVLSVMTFRTPAEAVERANDSTYGLAAGVWSEKASKVAWVAERLRAGVVWTNCYNRFDPTSPFGGFRESGYGREGGRHGLAAYCGPTDRTAALLADHSPTGQSLAEVAAPAAIAAGPARPEPEIFGSPAGGCTYAALPAAARFVRPGEAVFIDLEVRKTHKLYIGGALVRSESGATVPTDAGEVPSASRKDARDAVVAATKAQSGWAARTPYNRGQILYRVAEMLDSRTDLPSAAAAAARWVHWAGWTDKLGAVFGTVNDISGPYDSVSAPTPVGVVAVVVPAGATLDTFADLVAAPLAAGCSVIAVVDPADAHLLVFAEVAATSDVPGGVLNIVTGARPEVAATLAAHSGVHAVDLAGAGAAAADLEVAAAQNLVRVRRPGAATDPMGRLSSFVEIRTTWGPRSR